MTDAATSLSRHILLPDEARDEFAKLEHAMRQLSRVFSGSFTTYTARHEAFIRLAQVERLAVEVRKSLRIKL